MSNDARLLAAMANIRDDKNGKRVDFKSCVSCRLPECPVQRKKSQQNQLNDKREADIGGTVGNYTPGLGSKKGKSVAELCWHMSEEFTKLSQNQKRELKKSHRERKGHGKRNNSFHKDKSDKSSFQTRKKVKGMVASAIGGELKSDQDTLSVMNESQMAITSVLSSLAAKHAEGQVKTVKILAIEATPVPATAEVVAAEALTSLMRRVESTVLKLQGIMKKSKA